MTTGTANAKPAPVWSASAPAALSEIARTLQDGGRAIVIEDFDTLSGVAAANPIATLRAWFARAGLECQRVHPVDTEDAHLLVALARRPAAGPTLVGRVASG